jgi:hypothetical protein
VNLHIGAATRPGHSHQNLEFYRFNQKTLRADKYSTTHHGLAKNIKPSDIGLLMILPSRVKGSARNMQQVYQDSMAIVRAFRKPSFFITFTCNPYWDKIQRELLTDRFGVPSQSWRAWLDLIARVFHLKLEALKKDLTGKDGIFGPHVADVHVIEYQKRGMPHAHLLLWISTAVYAYA